mmetsp:Transcript_10938/g.22341  ORF Transcript_10938/g.22341 Transcript_10938/m.22341 type:complete len:124 (+) Transcript_10938:3-374(+)
MIFFSYSANGIARPPSRRFSNIVFTFLVSCQHTPSKFSSFQFIDKRSTLDNATNGPFTTKVASISPAPIILLQTPSPFPRCRSNGRKLQPPQPLAQPFHSSSSSSIYLDRYQSNTTGLPLRSH